MEIEGQQDTKRKYKLSWMGDCLKCGEALKSVHHSGICSKCRTLECVKCKKRFRPNVQKPSMCCSSCREKLKNEEYRFNMDEEHYL